MGFRIHGELGKLTQAPKLETPAIKSLVHELFHGDPEKIEHFATNRDADMFGSLWRRIRNHANRIVGIDDGWSNTFSDCANRKVHNGKKYVTAFTFCLHRRDSACIIHTPSKHSKIGPG